MKPLIFSFLAIMIAEGFVPPPSFEDLTPSAFSSFNQHIGERRPLLLKVGEEENVKSKHDMSKCTKIVANSADFQSVRFSKGFVDKTLFIRSWMDHLPRYTYITAPTNFGKSTLMNMIQAFLGVELSPTNPVTIQKPEKSQALAWFTGTQILMKQNQDFFKKYFKNYIIIKLDFSKFAMTKDLQSFQGILCNIIKQMVREHSYLKNHDGLLSDAKKWIENYSEDSSDFCTDNFLNYSLNTGNYLLSLFDKAFGKPVILLVDEYDGLYATPLIRENKVANTSLMVSYLERFVEGFVKNGNYEYKTPVHRALMFGSFNEGIMQLVSNICQQDFYEDDETADSFGLTPDERGALIRKLGVPEECYPNQCFSFFCSNTPFPPSLPK